MATVINEHFIIKNDRGIADMEFFLNADNEIFAVNPEEERFWFTIKKEDWEELKKFIDKKFKNAE